MEELSEQSFPPDTVLVVAPVEHGLGVDVDLGGLGVIVLVDGILMLLVLAPLRRLRHLLLRGLEVIQEGEH